MEKIIFFSLVIPIFGFVIYLGGSAIMKGFSAKTSKRNENTEYEEDSQNNSIQLSNELNKLNELLKNGILTKEEFEKAKKKILDN
tara:strand:+ start:361 stop:615 length:255 start_codon:yes stop_codon:yes gene_type:complete